MPEPGDRLSARYRVLDPAAAARDPEGRRPAPTVYVGDRLLVHGVPGRDFEDRLTQLRTAVESDVRVDHPEQSRDEGVRVSRHVQDRLGDSGLAVLDRVSVTPLDLVATDERPERTPDAWEVLQRVRTEAPGLRAHVGLDHVFHACPTWQGTPYWSGSGTWAGTPYWSGSGSWGGVPYWSGSGTLGTAEYAVPGRGGRMPVSLQLADPAASAPPVPRRPNVAVPDTGLGTHPWFPDAPPVVRTPTWGGQPIGSGAVDDPGVSNDLIGALDPLYGHGTFICGLIRQGCPAAGLVAFPVMGSDGTIEESRLLPWLTALLMRHLAGQASGTAEDVIDVLSLSLGFYHETSEDNETTAHLSGLMREFGRAGVIVVAAAGNDATTTPMLPAGLAGPGGTGEPDPNLVPLVSVGALNPDGLTVALFSNQGEWVSCFEPGAAVVSTMPTADGSAQPTVALTAEHRDRSTIQPEDYRGGFAAWSGTSFAAPVLAARLGAQLAADSNVADISVDAMRARAWSALQKVLGWTRT